MDKKFITIAIASILIGVLIGTVIVVNKPQKNNENANLTDYEGTNENNTIEENNESQNEINITPAKKIRDDIKAIYLTGWSAGTKTKRESCIEALKENGFNAVVIDIKDEAGRLSYKSNVQTAIDIVASANMISNIESVINEFKENDIYVIGRIVTFKDPLYAKNISSIAYHKEDGSLWTDFSGNNWPNPYNQDSWEYPIALAKEAATLGFDEIQFDYVRFPSSEGKVKQIAYGFDSSEKTKSDTINAYLTKVMDELSTYNICVSADVFGIITKRSGDFENIGQDFSAIAKIVDVVCPMVYPSHYASGEYKLAYPDKNPYSTVFYSVNDGLKRYEETEDNENMAIIRPYLQDFTASWLGKGKYLTYSTEQVKDQIQACFDLRINSFTLWDPSNKYCYDALGKAHWMSDEEYEESLKKELTENMEVQ